MGRYSMTAANKLTLIRLALVPVFLTAVSIRSLTAHVVALVVFIGASLTDLYDGKLARRTGTVTRIGTYMDPLADKLLIAAALIAFVEYRELRVPAWMVVLIVSREFLITGLRSLAAARGITMAAEKAGKWKTAAQMTAIITILVIMVVNDVLASWPELMWGWSGAQLQALAVFTTWTPYALSLVATTITVWTGVTYMHKYRKMIREELRTPPAASR